jgi:biotin carboxyl carrier protein
MFKPKRMVNIILLACLLVCSASALAAGIEEQKSALSGKVSAHGLVARGARVQQGDVLVRIESVTGPVPAVRATTDGVVAEVLVKAGDSISSGQVAATITSAK